MSKIMLIEDDTTMLSLLRTLLQMEAYEVVQTRDDRLDEILTQLSEEQPDLALIDIHLRHGSGFDLLQQIKKDDGLKDIRILMSSGMDFSTQCLEAGADGFILKPYMPDDLINLIRQTI